MTEETHDRDGMLRTNVEYPTREQALGWIAARDGSVWKAVQ